MIVFLDVKKDATVVNVGDKAFQMLPVTHKWFKGELKGLFELFKSGGHIEDVDIEFKGGEYPNLFVDAGFLNREVIELVETCGIPNVYAVKLMPNDLKILASSGKQTRAKGHGDDSNTMTLRLINHSISLNSSIAGRKIKHDTASTAPAMTHQETTDRINALASALGALNAAPIRLVAGSKEQDLISKVTDEIVTELSKLTQQD